MTKPLEVYLGDGSRNRVLSTDIRVSGWKFLSDVPRGATTALVRALNRAAESGRATAVKEVREIYTPKAKDIRQAITLEKANKNTLMAGISSKGRRMPLTVFAHKPKTDTTGAKRRPIYVSVKKEGGYKNLKNGFIWNGNVMQRVGKERHKITRRTGLSFPHMLNNPDIVEKIMKTMQETTDKRLEHEINRLLEKQK